MEKLEKFVERYHKHLFSSVIYIYIYIGDTLSPLRSINLGCCMFLENHVMLFGGRTGGGL